MMAGQLGEKPCAGAEPGAKDSPGASLAGALEQWLARAQSLRAGAFPPVLQASYDSDTRRARSRGMGFFGLAGGLVALLLYPLLRYAVTDLGDVLALLFVGICVPVTLALAAIVLLDPAPWLREILMAIPVVVDTAVISWVFGHSHERILGLFISTIILIQVFAAVTVQLRFMALLPAAIVSYAMVCGAIFARGQDGPHTGVMIVGGVVVLYLLAANYRMEGEQRRGYALMLRERLRQQELTDRNRALDEMARSDALTGLANRRAFDDWLDAFWRNAAEQAMPLGLLMIDIDRFKAFNDSHGHPAGDGCLRMVAGCLRHALPIESDFCARIGGEEFAVLLPGMSGEACLAVAERLREAVLALAIPHPAHGIGGVITISCGAASLVPEDSESPAGLFRAADAALYWAKRTGRNRISGGAAPVQASYFPRNAAAMPA